MTNHRTEVSQRQAAMTAGLGLLVMTVVFLLSDSLIFQKLIVPDDAATTADNIAASANLFRSGIGGLVIVALCDILVAWALFVFFAKVNRSLSLLAGWFRLVYSVLLVVALFNYVGVLQLLSGADYLHGIHSDHLNADVMLSLSAFSDEWSIGLLIFGLHLLILGYLALRSDDTPKFLGVLLVIAGPAYVIDGFGKMLTPDYGWNLAMIVGWGELVFMFWLLCKSVRSPGVSQ